MSSRAERALAWLEEQTAALRAVARELREARAASKPTAAQAECFE